MAGIYRGAHFTLAASLSLSDDDGFLHPRWEREVYSSKHLDITFAGKTYTDIWTRVTHDLRQHSFYDVKEVLATRCWTMQERMLSSRLVSVTSAVTFDCASMAACECGHDLYPDPLYPPLPMLRGVDNKLAFLSLLKNEAQSIQKMYSTWKDIVTVYSGRHLTYESDRQVALSAIAKLLAEKYQAEYVAGLWRGDLVTGLCWRSDLDLPAIKSLGSDPLRPSWSWLAARRLVYMPDLTLNPSCLVRSVEVTNGNYDDSGPPQGYIKLTAPTGVVILYMEKQFQPNESENKSPSPSFELRAAHGRPVSGAETLELHLDAWLEPCRVVDTMGNKLTSARRATAVTVPEATFSSKVWALHLGWDEVNSQPSRLHYFVLIGALEGQGQYERIGCLRGKITDEVIHEWLGHNSHQEIVIF